MGVAVGQRVLGRGPGGSQCRGKLPAVGVPSRTQAWTLQCPAKLPLLRMPNMVPRPGVGNLSLGLRQGKIGGLVLRGHLLKAGKDAHNHSRKISRVGRIRNASVLFDMECPGRGRWSRDLRRG